MINSTTRPIWLFLILAFGLLICGCPATRLSGSASMRVDVEVYNGPLARSIQAQEAELLSAVGHVADTFERLRLEAEMGQCVLGCFTTRTDNNNPPPVCTVYSYHNGNEPSAYVVSADNGYLDYLVMRKKHLNEISERDSELQTNSESLEKEMELIDYFIAKYKNIGITQDGEAPRDSRHDVKTAYRFNAKIGYKREDEKHHVCPLLHGLETDARRIRDDARVLRDTITPSGLLFYYKAARLGHLLRSKGEFWATTHIGVVPDSTRTRIQMVQFTNSAAELGNEVAARSDALIRQLDSDRGGEGDHRQRLPTSLYLRDGSGTDYLNLTKWFDASVSRSGKFGSAEDRVKMIERLITDTHWSKINTVFASGQGDVQMAFIKDDIGNWNLKSFSNDPTELLKAYKDVGLAAVKAAADAAAKISSQGGSEALKGVLDMANKVALGKGSGVSGGIELDGIRHYTRSRLLALQADQKSQAAHLKTEITEANDKVTEADGKKTTAKEERDTARSALENLNNDIRESENRKGKLEAQGDQNGIDTEEATLKNLVSQRETALDAYTEKEKAYDEAAAALTSAKEKEADLKNTLAALPEATRKAAALIFDEHLTLIDKLQENVSKNHP